MRLRELTIKNFRKIEDLTVTFPKGLCVIVGENNTGKTAIVDALRLMLFSGRDYDALRLDEEDFRTGTDFAPIELSCTFCDQNDEDEVHFQECLVDIGGGKFEIRLNARVEFNKTTRNPKVKMWGGETEGGHVGSIYEHLAAVYLQPLRDPESGLRPSRHSQVSRLLDSLTDEDQYDEFVTIAKDANTKIRELDPVKSARDDLNTQMSSIAGDQLAQKTELIFADPTFHRIIAGLQPEIENLPFSLNGLGYNNLIFTSATLATLKRSPHFSFRSIVIEEPEAHLHPQLQVLLLQYFSKVAAVESGEVQVIASSHSPILASQAPIDSIVSLQEYEGKVSAISVCSIDMDAEMKKKLQRYLDSTRAELFFARRILMVEGISEALLLPVLVKIACGDLKQSAVTLINADGLNFNCFLPLFGETKIAVPIAILTDGDAPSVGGPLSATATQLKAQEGTIQNLRVECCARTFEHELARSSELLPLMLQAFKILRPVVGANLESNIQSLTSDDQKADAFLSEFLNSRASKGLFAQELATLLENESLQPTVVPDYIRKALQFLSVLNSPTNDESTGNSSRTNPSPAANQATEGCDIC